MSSVLYQTGFVPRVHVQRRPSRRGAPRLSRKSLRRRSLMTWKSPQLPGKERLSRQTRRERMCSTKVQSALGFISHTTATHDLFDAAVNSLVGGSALICFALAFVPLLTYEPESGQQMEPDELDAVKWSVAGVVSFFPYLNWTVERVAQTEPAVLGSVMQDEQEMTSVLGEISRSLAQQFSSITSKMRFPSKRASKEDSLKEMVRKELQNQEGELHDTEELARIEQNLWDQKFDTDKNKH